jgi:prophage maintenance system killer protein
MTFLELNGYDSNCDEESIAITFEQLSEGNLNDSQLAIWLDEHAVPLKTQASPEG